MIKVARCGIGFDGVWKVYQGRHLVNVNLEGSDLWKVCCACKVQNVYVIEDFISVESAENEDATVRDDGRVIPSRSGRLACDGARLECESD